MKTAITRPIALMTALLLIVTVFTSCGKKTVVEDEYYDVSGTASSSSQGEDTNTESEGGTESTQTAQSNADSSKQDTNAPKTNVNVKGYTFRVVDHNSAMWDKKSKDATDMLRQQILADVEKKLGCKIEVVTGFDYNKYFETYQQKIMSGVKVGDIIAAPTYTMGQFLAAGMLTDVKKVNGLDLSKPYWNQNVIKATTIGGKVYGVSNALYPHVKNIDGIYFNKKLLKEATSEDLYKLAEQKKWTFDKFMEICNAFKAKNPASSGKYAFGGPDWEKSIAFFMAFGNKVLSASGNKVEYVLNNSKTIDSVNKIKPLMVKGNLSTDIAGQNFTTLMDAFAADKLLFFLGRSSYVEQSNLPQIREMKSDFGFLPIPMGPGMSDYNNWVEWNSQTIVVPVTNKDLDKTGAILEEIAYQMHTKLYDKMISNFSDRYYRDDESVKMLKLMDKTCAYDLIFTGAQGKTELNAIIEQVIVKSCEDQSADIAQALQSYDSAAKAAVNEFFNPR